MGLHDDLDEGSEVGMILTDSGDCGSFSERLGLPNVHGGVTLNLGRRT